MTVTTNPSLQAETGSDSQRYVRNESKSNTSTAALGIASDFGSPPLRKRRRRVPAKGEVWRVAPETIEALRRMNQATRVRAEVEGGARGDANLEVQCYSVTEVYDDRLKHKAG